MVMSCHGLQIRDIGISPKVAKLFIDDYKKTFKDILKTRYFGFFFQEFRGKPMKNFPILFSIP